MLPFRCGDGETIRAHPAKLFEARLPVVFRVMIHGSLTTNLSSTSRGHDRHLTGRIQPSAAVVIRIRSPPFSMPSKNLFPVPSVVRPPRCPLLLRVLERH